MGATVLGGEPIWDNLTTALGAEPRDHPVLVGKSGLEHRFLGIGIDEVGKRIIVYSGDPDARLAALTQVDVQAALSEYRVLIARPIVVDLGVLSRQIVEKLGSAEFRLGPVLRLIQRYNTLPAAKQDKMFRNFMGTGIDQMAMAFQHVSLPTVAQFITVIQQASNFDWSSLFQQLTDQKSGPLVDLTPLSSIDNLAIDRAHGICPLPLYELGKDEWALFASKKDPDLIQLKLKEMGVYQYFFPGPDDLAMGFVDKGIVTVDRLEQAIAKASELGHELGPATLVGTQNNLLDMMDALGERGYMAEGELGYELTPQGNSYRGTFKVRPKEGVIERISKIVKINLDLDKLLKP